ncbi:sulfite dehydrogenase (cytochrome) subunit SorA apoprotein [Tistlia consotensis]|uniref:Sulfite dehydrogenase (Cytochrome) subunit SorA apoprotein n=1 Tax=Tistlia consotensis USBA 355 TaxID=560819 RepID=A0A1Y6B8Z1_9PROT|nr:molybdopterin-dependent oxidoreductase [Tistlia consotensis]SME90773.1 sulfite dehydrogenase (cytochrome) subunit SorA apoprotein [Tistlia consotensis USBA 355]SNR26934.1 sulfite dehydrogenase (cytochrome) subunit SorA apoprotein [Tistlia consotensis]
MLSRRQVLKSAGAAALGVGSGLAAPALAALAADGVTLPFANGERPLVRYPGKRPLIGLTERPPQLETPFAVFDESVITPNDAFFVRYHLAGIPLEIDPDAYRIAVGGRVDQPLSLSLAELKSGFEPLELVAVNQCSGNSRGFFEPRVGGGQLGNGAMGNARWTGVPLKAVLDRAGVRAGAVQVSFDGLDGPVLPETPDFAKALDIDHARDGEVMIAYAMNGAELPWLNGYPVRLIVPGWYGTYWVKHLSAITVLDHEFESFWMDPAYRIPDNACTEPGRKAAKTVPINRFDVRSFVTSVADGETVPADRPLALRGIAFDGGYGIAEVELSADGGRSWLSAALGDDLGRYSFRQWTASVRLPRGEHRLLVKATNRIGESQPLEPLWNPSGYRRNVVETTRVVAA